MNKKVRIADPAERHARALLRSILGPQAGLLNREGMKDTPRRMVKALRELTDGYAEEVVLTSFERRPGNKAPIVVVRDIEFASLCEHHVLPFSGTVSLGYIPGARIVGLSKIPRIVRKYARRLQVQEHMTDQIADALMPLGPLGVCVVAKGRHTCCSHRGVEASALMVTSALRGVFDNEPSARAEAMMLLGAAD